MQHYVTTVRKILTRRRMVHEAARHQIPRTKFNQEQAVTKEGRHPEMSLIMDCTLL